jgi:hypothetical protein
MNDPTTRLSGSFAGAAAATASFFGILNASVIDVHNTRVIAAKADGELVMLENDPPIG